MAETVTGTYLQRIAVPPNAVFDIKLFDVSRADVAGDRRLASKRYAVTDVPVPFSLDYDPALSIGGAATVSGCRASIYLPRLGTCVYRPARMSRLHGPAASLSRGWTERRTVVGLGANRAAQPRNRANAALGAPELPGKPGCEKSMADKPSRNRSNRCPLTARLDRRACGAAWGVKPGDLTDPMDALGFIDRLPDAPARYAPFFPYGATQPRPCGWDSELVHGLPVRGRDLDNATANS